MPKPLRSGFRRLTKTLLLLLGGGEALRTPGPTPTQPASWRSVGRWTWGGVSQLRPRTVRASVGFWAWGGFSRLVAGVRRASAGLLWGRGASGVRAVLLRRAQVASVGRLERLTGRVALRVRADDEDLALLLALRASEAKRAGRWRM